MEKLIRLMSEFGAEFMPKNKVNFPLKIISTEMPIGINYKSGVSAQLKSAVMLAGLNAFGHTEIIETEKSRDHTENMLQQNSNSIKVKKGKKKIIKIYGKKNLNSLNINIPGDPSSAAFFTALTLLNKDSSLKIKNVGINPTRIGFYELLRKSGAKIKFSNKKKESNEIVADIFVESKKIKPIIASQEFYVKATDEYPILFIISALTNGTSIFKNVGGLKNKESDRIKEMQKVLRQVGIRTLLSKNELKIFGKGMINANNKKIIIPNLGDHRIAMSAFVLASLTGAKTKIKNFETVFTSSPSFLKIMKFLGAKFEKQ